MNTAYRVSDANTRGIEIEFAPISGDVCAMVEVHPQFTERLVGFGEKALHLLAELVCFVIVLINHHSFSDLGDVFAGFQVIAVARVPRPESVLVELNHLPGRIAGITAEDHRTQAPVAYRGCVYPLRSRLVVPQHEVFRIGDLIGRGAGGKACGERKRARGGNEITASKGGHVEDYNIAMAETGRIVGIGGIFFKAEDHATLKSWYQEKLGLVNGPAGVMFPWRPVDEPDVERLTIWSVFPKGSNYFGPSKSQFMINYIVDDLDAFLAKLDPQSVTIDPKREDHEYGRFAWIYDPEGNKIELWQPS